jgi:hypothetical protein
VTDDLYPGPADEDRAKTMAAEDAVDTVEWMRGWSSEHPAMPLLREYGDSTEYQERAAQRRAEEWSDDLWQTYVVALRRKLEKANLHLIEQPDPDNLGRAYVVDLKQWERVSGDPPDIAADPNAGWRRRARD